MLAARRHLQDGFWQDPLPRAPPHHLSTSISILHVQVQPSDEVVVFAPVARHVFIVDCHITTQPPAGCQGARKWEAGEMDRKGVCVRVSGRSRCVRACVHESVEERGPGGGRGAGGDGELAVSRG